MTWKIQWKKNIKENIKENIIIFSLLFSLRKIREKRGEKLGEILSRWYRLAISEGFANEGTEIFIVADGEGEEKLIKLLR